MKTVTVRDLQKKVKECMDPAFWKLIHARRKQPTITLDQLKAWLRKEGRLEASKMTGHPRGKKSRS